MPSRKGFSSSPTVSTVADKCSSSCHSAAGGNTRRTPHNQLPGISQHKRWNTPLPNGTYDITVTLYADEAETTPIWKSTYNTSVHNGIFNLYLGSGDTPLPSSQQMNRPLWVGTSVNGSNQMLPLTPLTSSPYALNLPDKAVTTGKLADGSVTAEKMGTPYVAGIALNGKTITADGTVLNIEVGDGIALTFDEETRTLKLSKAAPTLQGEGEKEKQEMELEQHAGLPIKITFRVGRYRIELNPVKETGAQADSTVDFSCASVTATISSGQSYDGSAHGECKFITTSLIGANNIFDVYITENWITPQGQLSCRSVDAAFTFKVTGRLQDRP